MHSHPGLAWVENQPISSNQVQNVLGSEQVNALAAKMGVDPAQASHFLAEYLPKIVDKLTPTGKVDPQRGPPAGFGCVASVALAKSSGRGSRRSVRAAMTASVRLEYTSSCGSSFAAPRA
jgi:hypothetical protein